VRRASLLAAVRTDLLDILTHIARESGSVSVAQRFVARLRQRCDELAALPGTLGRARPELHPDIRSSTCRGYVIFFRYVGNRFEVVNILEGHRDLEAIFHDEPEES
jgi:toxin ParE1/3/4